MMPNQDKEFIKEFGRDIENTGMEGCGEMAAEMLIKLGYTKQHSEGLLKVEDLFFLYGR